MTAGLSLAPRDEGFIRGELGRVVAGKWAGFVAAEVGWPTNARVEGGVRWTF